MKEIAVQTIKMHKNALKRLISRGATEYSVVDGIRRLSSPDGRLSVELPSAETDPDNSIARYALEQIAWREYRQVEGRVVLVNWLTGYDDDNGRSSDVHFGQPIRVRVDRNAKSNDICRWMDEDHLDPVWDVDLIDQDEPILAGMRSFWLYATSRSLSGRIEKSDLIAVESTVARVARALGFGKPTPNDSALRI